MRIREYTSGDFDALRRMHSAQGFGYPFPDLESPLFVSKLVLEDDDEGREEARGNSLPESSRSALRWPSFCASQLKRICCTIPQMALPVSAGSDSSRFTRQRETARPREVSTTFKRFSRRESRARSDAACHASAGRKIPGLVFQVWCFAGSEL